MHIIQNYNISWNVVSVCIYLHFSKLYTRQHGGDNGFFKEVGVSRSWPWKPRNWYSTYNWVTSGSFITEDSSFKNRQSTDTPTYSCNMTVTCSLQCLKLCYLMDKALQKQLKTARGTKICSQITVNRNVFTKYYESTRRGKFWDLDTWLDLKLKYYSLRLSEIKVWNNELLRKQRTQWTGQVKENI